MNFLVRHSHHLVEESPWPLLASIGGFFLTSGFLYLFYYSSPVLIFLSIFSLCLTSYQWWRDVRVEASVLGIHTYDVEEGLRWGILLFICSEVLFFVSFFWAYFHRRLAPRVDIGGLWPPKGVLTFNPFEVPLLNTIVLLSSGVTVTWCHHSIIEGNHKNSIISLILTVSLGLYFTALQGLEYFEASFRIADRVYGRTFFIATGFHGLHVIVGTLFLSVCLIRLFKGHFSAGHHFGFEAAAWYWHFVDVVWLFLYIRIYWWGGN